MDAIHTWVDSRLLADRDRPAETFAVFYRRHVTSVLAFYARRNVDVSRAARLTERVFQATLRQRAHAADQASTASWLHGIAGEELARDLAVASRGRVRSALTLRRSRPRTPLGARDRAEYSTLAFGPFDVLDVLAERSLPRASSSRPAWSGGRARRAHADDVRG